MILSDLSNSSLEHLINDWIHSERNRNILKRRYIDGLKIEVLAEEFDMSVRQIQNIIKDSTKILLKHCI